MGYDSIHGVKRAPNPRKAAAEMARSKTFPKREDWKSPWAKSGAAFDEKIAETLIYNLQRDAHGAAGDENEELTELREELEEAQTALATATQAAEAAKIGALPQGEQLLALIEKALAPKEAAPETKTRVKKVTPAETDELSPAEIRALKLEIGIDQGLSKADALRLVGTDEDELKEDAVQFLKDHPKPGNELEGDEGDEGGDEGDEGGEATTDATPTTTPQIRPRETYQPPLGGRVRSGDSNDPGKLLGQLYPAGRR